MTDPLEFYRLKRLREINSAPKSRDELEAKYGQVWDAQQLAEEYEVLGFLAPFVVVQRKNDSVKGSLEFQHYPRFYFHFMEDHQ